ncbi:MAG: PKD domain-containing protein [Methylococcaceae bacterium]|nr:PKD domain-containing protein [Methylococcaceae bacterium]
MKTNMYLKPGNMTIAFVIFSYLVFSSYSFASDLSQLVGKDLEHNRDFVAAVMKGRNYVVEVDQQGKIKQIVDTGANGDGTEPQQVVKAASFVDSSATVFSVDLPTNFEGQDAIDYMGVDLPAIASLYGLTPDKLQDIFLNDNTVRIDSNNRIFYVDNTVEQQVQPTNNEPDVAGVTTTGSTSNNPLVPIASQATLANTFKLHSKLGASKTIYLDFVGYTATNTKWSASTIVAPAFDLNGDPLAFDNNERSNIISIWNRVSEDYIPFDVDVTTEPPLADALLRTSNTDTTYGTRVVITKSGTINCNCGGVAYVGVVSMLNNYAYQPAWVFQQSLANNEKYIAEAISHEAGHTLGLIHDGQKIGTTVNSYYLGHGSGVVGWAPIMGAGYYANVTQWANGVYPGANNQQNDIAVLASRGILPRGDDVGNTITTASSLTDSGTAGAANIQKFGVIETSNDIDMFLVNTAGGLVNLTASPVVKGPNLDTRLTLYKSDGTVVATDAPEPSLSAAIKVTVPAGMYFLAVSGSGHASAGSDYGYPTYGSLGQYQVTGSYTAASIALSPTAELTASTLTGPASLTVNFSASNSVGNGSIIEYRWSFGDGTTSTLSNPSHTYTTVGLYTVTLTIKNQFQLTSTITTTITVTAPPAPSLHVASASLGIFKASKLRARVSITVMDAQGRLVPNAVVNGSWSGGFTGNPSSKTGANGIVVHASNAIEVGKGGSGIYTIKSISLPGYTYNSAQNVKNIMTVTW